MIFKGDVYWCDLPFYTSHVQYKTRPVIVIQNDIGNKNSDTVIIVPTTTKVKCQYLPTHIPIDLEKTSIALCEQILTIDKSMLKQYITTLDYRTLKQLEKGLRKSLAL